MKRGLVAVCVLLSSCVDGPALGPADSGIDSDADAGPLLTSCPETPRYDAPSCDSASFSPNPGCVYPGDTGNPGADCYCTPWSNTLECFTGSSPCPADPPAEYTDCLGEYACVYGDTRCDCVLVLDAGFTWQCYGAGP